MVDLGLGRRPQWRACCITAKHSASQWVLRRDVPVLSASADGPTLGVFVPLLSLLAQIKHLALWDYGRISSNPVEVGGLCRTFILRVPSLLLESARTGSTVLQVGFFISTEEPSA